MTHTKHKRVQQRWPKIACALLLSTIAALAEPATNSPPSTHPPATSANTTDFTSPDWDASQASSSQLAAIEHILLLDAAELNALRQTLERIASLTPEQHAALLQRVHEFRKLSERDRRRIISEYRELPQEERRLLRAYWHNLPPKQAEQLRNQLRSMTPQQRIELRDQIIAKARDQGLASDREDELEKKPTRTR